MKIVDVAVFAGPSLYASRPVLVVTLDAASLEGRTAVDLLADRLADVARRLPALPAGTQLAQTPLPALVAQLITALHRTVGGDRVAASAQALGVRNLHRIGAEYDSAPVAREAAMLAVALVGWMSGLDADDGRGARSDFEPAQEIGRFLASAPRFLLDQTTRALVAEAERRAIPWRRLDDADRLIQLGHGARQVRIRETLTTASGALAVGLAHSKSRTVRLLRELALPTTRQSLVHTEHEAVRAAEHLGYPVVVKPEDRGQSRAVSVGLVSANAVIDAFRRARRESPSVVVEAQVPGDDHRMLVVDGALVAAVKRVAAHVVGDGERTIEALVEAQNRDPRRGTGFSNLLVRIEFDAETERVLGCAGYTRTSVPAAGEHVRLRGPSSISAGGTSVDVTRIVHPDNRLAVERAARVVGLDIAGVDFLTPDIARSWREVGGAILEINQSPGLRPHWVAEGSPDVTAAIMDRLVPPGRDARVPIAAVTGTNGKTTTTMLTAHILGLDGRTVGSATTHGVRVGADTVARGDFAGGRGGTMLLLDPKVEAVVLETARRGLIRHGLVFDGCDVGAVLNIGSDHVGTDGIATTEDLARVKRLVVAHARRMAVLNADDPLCVGLAPGLPAERLCWVSLRADSPLVLRHVAGGQPAVWLDGSAEPVIVLHDGSMRHDLIPVAQVPIAMGGAARHNVQNAMFAAAIGFGLGESTERIRAGLRTFRGDPASNPGRCNVYDGLPFRVIFEYAHNPEALEATAQFARSIEVAGQRIAVLWSMGNRIDGHYAALARAAAEGFDRFVCMEPPDARGRAAGDISRLIGLGLRAAGVAADRIDVVPDEHSAIARALALARPGDLVMLCCRDFEAAWRQVTSFRPAVS